MKTVQLAVVLASSLIGMSQARAIELDCAAPVVTVGATNNPGADPVTSVSVSDNARAWRVVYTLASGATINRADQYTMINSTEKGQWSGTLNKRPKLFMKGTIFNGDAPGAFVYREMLFDMSKGGGPQQQLVMSMAAQCTLSQRAPAPVVAAAPVTPASAKGALDGLESFNKFFKESIAQGMKLNVPIERFNEEKEVGWEQTIVIETMVVKLTVLISPPSTFAIKHLCVGDVTVRPITMTCVTNLGQSYIETKNAAGAFVQSDFINLPWYRDLANLSFD
jgi:hypothetical protein